MKFYNETQLKSWAHINNLSWRSLSPWDNSNRRNAPLVLVDETPIHLKDDNLSVNVQIFLGYLKKLQPMSLLISENKSELPWSRA